MILFTLLAIVAVVAVIVAVVAAGAFGMATLVAFGDVLVCALILYGIIKIIFFRKKK